jgi:hypothetical protein
MEDQAAAGRRRIDGFGQRAEPHALRLEASDRLDQMRQRPPKAIEFPDHQHVAVADVIERLREPGPFGARSRGRILEDADAPCRSEGVALEIGVLVLGADAGVADERHPWVDPRLSVFLSINQLVRFSVAMPA